MTKPGYGAVAFRSGGLSGWMRCAALRMIRLVLPVIAIWAAGTIAGGKESSRREETISFDAKVRCAVRLPVMTPYRGTVVSVGVREGQRVKEGESLARFRLEEQEVSRLLDIALGASLERQALEVDALRREVHVLSRSVDQEQKLADLDLAATGAIDLLRLDLELAKRRVELLEKKMVRDKDRMDAEMARLEEILGVPVSPESVPEEVDLWALMDGTVIWMSPEVHHGLLVGGRKTLFQVGRMDPIVVQGVIHEMEWHKIAIGDSAEVSVASLPKRTFPATVKRVAWVPTTMDPGRPTYYEIALEVPNPDLALKEGFKCRVEIKTSR